MFPRIIGLSGLAGSGKDMCFQLLSQQIPNLKRFALADKLKEELRVPIQQLYGIDILTCSREEKDSVRPLLVAHGKIRRDREKGKHWTSILKTQIDNEWEYKPKMVACVTDIRYDVYPEDEVFWIKNVMGGKLIHIQLYTEKDGQKIFTQPPNADEAENDPKVQAQADYKIIWPKLISTDNQNPDWNELSKYVTECVNAIN